ncbi:MAG TPA: hypothetical protein V6C63_06580, partial [Allocoleopsis sp.]
MLDSRWSIFRSYLLSARVLVSGSILFLATGVIPAQPGLANNLAEQEPPPQSSKQHPIQSQRQRQTQQHPANIAKTSNEVTGGETAKIHPQTRLTPAAIAPLPTSLPTPTTTPNTEADLVYQITGSQPEVLAQQVKTKRPNFVPPERSQSFDLDSDPKRVVAAQRSLESNSAPLTQLISTTAKLTDSKVSQPAPIKIADNYWQMNRGGLGAPGPSGSLPTLAPSEQPLPVPTPLPIVRPEQSGANFSPQQLPWMSGIPVPAPGPGVAYPYAYPYAVGQLPPGQMAPMPPGGWSSNGWNPNGGFYPMGQPLPAPMPTLMVPGSGGPSASDSANSVYFYNRFAPSPQPVVAPVAPFPTAPAAPNGSVPPTSPNFYNGAPNYPNNFYNGAPNYPNNFYSPNPVYTPNSYSPQPPVYPSNIYNNAPGYSSNFSAPALAYPTNSYPANSYPAAPGYPNNFYPPAPNYSNGFSNPALGYPGSFYLPNSYPPAPTNYPSNFSGPAPIYPGSVYNAAPTYPG